MAQVCFQKYSFIGAIFVNICQVICCFNLFLMLVTLVWCIRMLMIFQKKLHILGEHLKSNWSSIETFPKSLRKVTLWQKFSIRTSHLKGRFVWTLSKGTGSQAMASNTFYLWVMKHILFWMIFPISNFSWWMGFHFSDNQMSSYRSKSRISSEWGGREIIARTLWRLFLSSKDVHWHTCQTSPF